MVILSKKATKIVKHFNLKNNSKNNSIGLQKKYFKEESNLIKACIQYLELHGFIVIRNNSGIVFLEHKGKKRAIRMGTAGASDIIACSPDGKFVAIECKSSTGRLTEKQAEFIEKVKKCNGKAIVVRNIDDLILFLQTNFFNNSQVNNIYLKKAYKGGG